MRVQKSICHRKTCTNKHVPGTRTCDHANSLNHYFSRVYKCVREGVISSFVSFIYLLPGGRGGGAPAAVRPDFILVTAAFMPLLVCPFPRRLAPAHRILSQLVVVPLCEIEHLRCQGAVRLRSFGALLLLWRVPIGAWGSFWRHGLLYVRSGLLYEALSTV